MHVDEYARCPLLLQHDCCDAPSLPRPAATPAYRGQIVASGSTAYSIPWPPSFQRTLDAMKVFLVDIISLTRANCAQPMNYYDSMVVMLVGLKLLLLLVWLCRDL